MSVFYEYFKELLIENGMIPRVAVYFSSFSTFFLTVLLALLLYVIFRKIFLKLVGRIVVHTTGVWDDTLFDHKVFHVLAHILPALVIYGAAGFATEDIEWFPALVKGVAQIYLTVVVIVAISRFLNAAQEIYDTYPYAKDRPIKGYIQLVKILVYFVGMIVVISVLVGKNPASLFAGLGAMAAVLMLVFRDPILGFVASIQLAANNMIKPGDWITVPKFNVDGTVHDISLTTVKIQNWDKTITMIPTYSLVSEAVTNWAGMVESGGRRIQRSFHVDLSSVRFVDDPLLEKLRQLPRFKDFILPDAGLQLEYESDVDQQAIRFPLFGKPTNLSLYKRYLEGYLRNHPGIHENMTRIVRFLQSGDKGLPIEIIVFSKAQQTDLYESLQAEIFDHIYGTLPQFGLRLFQSPTTGNYSS